MFNCCYAENITMGQPPFANGADLDMLDAVQVQLVRAVRPSKSAGSLGASRSYHSKSPASTEEDTFDTWTYDSESPVSRPMRRESTTATSLAGTECAGGEAPKVFLDSTIVDALKALAKAASQVTPRERLSEELARLVAPFVQEVASTYRCSKSDALSAINGVLIDHGFAEADALSQCSEAPRMHQASPAAGDSAEGESEVGPYGSEVEESELQKSMRMQRLRCFLASSGFRSVNAPKNAGVGVLRRSMTYPLHAAVKANDIDLVQALLWAGSDPTKRDSQRLTPLELGYRLNRSGSHGAVVDVLATAMASAGDRQTAGAASANGGA